MSDYDTASCSAAWDVYDAADAAHELVRNEPVEFDESNPPFHHLDGFFDDGGQLLREIEADPNPPRCDTCGVALFRHLGLTGTCRQKMEAEAKLNTIFALMEQQQANPYVLDNPTMRGIWETILGLRNPREEGVNDDLVAAEAESLKAWVGARPWISQGTPAEQAEAKAAFEAWQLAKAAREAKEEAR